MKTKTPLAFQSTPATRASCLGCGGSNYVTSAEHWRFLIETFFPFIPPCVIAHSTKMYSGCSVIYWILFWGFSVSFFFPLAGTGTGRCAASFQLKYYDYESPSWISPLRRLGYVWQRWDVSSRPTRQVSLLQLKRHLLLLLLFGDIPKEKSPSKHSFLHLALIKRCVPAAGCSVSLQPGRRRWILCPLALIAQASLWLHGVGKYTVPSMWEGFEVSGKVLCFWCFSRAISFCLFFFFCLCLSAGSAAEVNPTITRCPRLKGNGSF